MSVNIQVSASMLSVKQKEVSLLDCRIEKKKNKKRYKVSIKDDKLEIPTKRSCEKIDATCKQNIDSIQKDIVSKKEKSRHKLRKLEKKYKRLEEVCHKYISPGDDQSKPSLISNDSKSTKLPSSTLLQLSQEVLQLEREVNAVLSSRKCDHHDNNSWTEDGCESFDLLLDLNKAKKRLLDEFDLNLSDQISTEDSRKLATDDSLNKSVCNDDFLHNSFDKDIERTTTMNESVSSRLDEDKQSIDELTEEILMDLKKSNLQMTPHREVIHFEEYKQNNSLIDVSVLSDIPKVQPLFSRNSLLRKVKPPANLISRQYKRLNVDFTIHELSAIYETDSDVSKNQTTIASLE